MPQESLPQIASAQNTASGRSGDPSAQTRRVLRPRSAVRLIAIALIGVVAGLLYYGLHDRFFLPECDSDRAKRTLSDILRELKFEPSRYEPITTVSSSKSQVVCQATLPLPGGGNVAIDYSFYWQGSQANIRYSVTRK